jgi:hypothetical protein
MAKGPQRDVRKRPLGAITIGSFGQFFFMSIYTQFRTNIEPAPWLDLRKIWPVPATFNAPHFELSDYSYEMAMKSTSEELANEPLGTQA